MTPLQRLIADLEAIPLADMTEQDQRTFQSATGLLRRLSDRVHTLEIKNHAQAERVRVLEEALKEARFFLSMLDGSCRASVHGYCNVNVPVDHLETVTAKVRAALKATGAPQ